jgi:hypothetical protein
VRRGDTVLVTAAAGGTGQFAVQLAAAAGATVVATCGGPAKAALLRRLGAARVIDYHQERVKDVLKREFPQARLARPACGSRAAPCAAPVPPCVRLSCRPEQLLRYPVRGRRPRGAFSRRLRAERAEASVSRCGCSFTAMPAQTATCASGTRQGPRAQGLPDAGLCMACIRRARSVAGQAWRGSAHPASSGAAERAAALVARAGHGRGLGGGGRRDAGDGRGCARARRAPGGDRRGVAIRGRLGAQRAAARHARAAALALGHHHRRRPSPPDHTVLGSEEHAVLCLKRPRPLLTACTLAVSRAQLQRVCLLHHPCPGTQARACLAGQPRARRRAAGAPRCRLLPAALRAPVPPAPAAPCGRLARRPPARGARPGALPVRAPFWYGLADTHG